MVHAVRRLQINFFYKQPKPCSTNPEQAYLVVRAITHRFVDVELRGLEAALRGIITLAEHSPDNIDWEDADKIFAHWFELWYENIYSIPDCYLVQPMLKYVPYSR